MDGTIEKVTDEEGSIGQKNSLTPGQIHYLYLWIHPQWRCPWTNSGVDAEIEEYKEFVDKLDAFPRTGLVQVPYGYRKDFRGSDVYVRFIKGLTSFDDYANRILGERYLVWEQGRFINGKNPGDVRKLVERFNLIEETQNDFVADRERFLAQNPRYLAKISVFGKERDTCPLGQATLWGLNKLASIILYHAEETPGLISPSTMVEPLPMNGYGHYVFEK